MDRTEAGVSLVCFAVVLEHLVVKVYNLIGHLWVNGFCATFCSEFWSRSDFSVPRGISNMTPTEQSEKH